MENAEEKTGAGSQPIRKTRSGRVVRPPPAKNSKTSGRKTKKKVVLMEVEVSDDDEPQEFEKSCESGDKEDTEERGAANEEKDSDLSALEEAVEFNINELHHLQDEKDTMEVDNLSAPEYAGESSDNVDVKGENSLMEVDTEKPEADGSDTPETNASDKAVESNHEADKPKVKPEKCDKDSDRENIKEGIDENSKRFHEKLNLKNEDLEVKNSEHSEILGDLKVRDSSEKSEVKDEDDEGSDKKENKQNGDPDTENISEDELPGVQVAKVPETEEVSDDELPGPKRAELPADTEVVSEDELPSVKKDSNKRKHEGDYDPGSPTSENEIPSKKPALETTTEKEKDEKPAKPKKLPELDKYWKAVNDDPTDFTGWTYLLQYVDQENDMEAAREAYDAFLSHYPYCYGYWRKYADYEKRKGNKKKCEEVFERGFKAIPLSVDLWIHYLTYVKTARPDDEDYIRSQFERALSACGLEFRSDRLWDSYIKWETEAKRLQKVTAIYDRLLATPTQGCNSHFDNFQEHVTSNAPNKVLEVDEFLALRKEVRHTLKHDAVPEVQNSDAPPGDEDPSKIISSDEETKAIRERIISIRRKIHKNTAVAVQTRWNYEEGIKRPYFHVKPLERCQLKNWQDYLDYEIEHGDKTRIIVLFERCLIACALYEEFWLKFVHYLESLKDPELLPKIRDVYERACTIHHLKKPNLHLQWAMFEEGIQNPNKAAEILVNLEKSVPNVLQVAYRRINLERRRSDFEKCSQLYEHYINNSKNKAISTNLAIKYSRFCLKVLKMADKAAEVLKTAITKDPNNPRIYLQLIDLTLQGENVDEKEVVSLIDSFLEKESIDIEQKVLFSQRKLEFLEDFGSDIQDVQKAYDDYQKYIKQHKEATKKKEIKSEVPALPNKKDSKPVPPSSSSNSYGNYGGYNNPSQGSYQYTGSQGQYGSYSQYQGDQYQYQGWQYPQGNYGSYNQWGSYSGGYGY